MNDRLEQNGIDQRKPTDGQLSVIVRGLEHLPAPSGVTSRLLELAGRAIGDGQRDPDESALLEIISLIRMDAALGGRALSMMAGSRSCDTIDGALASMSPRAILSVAMSVLAPSVPASDSLDHSGLWRHSLAVATTAQSLAPRAHGDIDPEMAFTSGLLHDLGKLALAECFPKSYARSLAGAAGHDGDLASFERDVIGVDHMLMGRRLAQSWRLPEPVTMTIWLHHHAYEAIPNSIAHHRLIGLVRLADTAVRRRGIGFSGNYAFVHNQDELAERLGISSDDLAQVVEDVCQEVARQGDSAGLDRTDSPSQLGQSIGPANLELGRLNERLQRQAQQLAAGARAMEHVGDFTESLDPNATVGQTLSRIAEVLGHAGPVEASPTTPVVAYSIGEEGQDVLAVRCDGTGPPAWRALSRTPGPLPDTVAKSAVEAAELLLADPADLSDWIDLETYVHQPLICASRWVGGALLAGANEPLRDDVREVLNAIAATLAFALAIVQVRCKAALLGERLAEASASLSARQQSLADAGTMAAVADLAAGAAHELNNPLAVVSGRAQLMSEQAQDPVQRDCWRLIATQAGRISDIISELMDFASPLPAKAVSIDVKSMLIEAVRVAQSNAPQVSRWRVDIDVSEDTPPIGADAKQLQSVMEELIANAVHAVTGDLELRLSARADEMDDGIILEIRDNGPGMDEQTMQRVFTPFFSLQRAGRRRGLGLSRVKRYIENNGGKIWIRSTPGEGMTVCMLLPRWRR